jgi:hypothetical protein
MQPFHVPHHILFIDRVDHVVSVGLYFPAPLPYSLSSFLSKQFLGIASRFLCTVSCALSLSPSVSLWSLRLVLELSSPSSPGALATGSALLDLRHEVPIA